MTVEKIETEMKPSEVEAERPPKLPSSYIEEAMDTHDPFDIYLNGL